MDVVQDLKPKRMEDRESREMAVAVRPQIVLFGDSITEQSFRPGGWGAALADSFSRKVSSLTTSHSRSEHHISYHFFFLHLLPG